MSQNDERSEDSLQVNFEAKAQYEQGMAYLLNRELDKAIFLLEKVSNNYDPLTDDFAGKSMSTLAMLHEAGIHPCADIEEAVRMYKLIAQKSNGVFSKLKLGLLYLEGWKIQHRPEAGLALIREALPDLETHSLIDAYDYYRLGEIFFYAKQTTNGMPSKESAQEAIKFFEKAVAQSRIDGNHPLLEQARDRLGNARKRFDMLNS